MIRPCLALIFSLALIFLSACATSLPEPEQPTPDAPYALLRFSTAMKLLAVDDQTLDARARVQTLRVSPGQHTLRFVHVAAGPDGSVAHAGQNARPFVLDTEAGVLYQFEAKT